MWVAMCFIYVILYICYIHYKCDIVYIYIHTYRKNFTGCSGCQPRDDQKQQAGPGAWMISHYIHLYAHIYIL